MLARGARKGFYGFNKIFKIYDCQYVDHRGMGLPHESEAETTAVNQAQTVVAWHWLDAAASPVARHDKQVFGRRFR